MATKTIVIGIGRGYPANNGKLAPSEWYEFRSSALEALSSLPTSVVYFTGEGVGVYEGETEESYTIVGSLDTAHVQYVPDHDDQTTLSELRARLATLSVYYGQDSIALTIGETEFVEA